MLYSIILDIESADDSITSWANNNTDTYRDGVYGVDAIGVYHMYYQSRTNLVEWIDPRPLESSSEEGCNETYDADYDKGLDKSL